MKDEIRESTALRVDILSLFPDYFQGPFDQSMIKQARKKGLLDIRLLNIRDFTDDPHRRADDRCYGGGPGMVMMAQPVTKAIRSVKNSQTHVVYLSPQGALLTADKCRELAKYKHLVLLCGHYEGIDQRVLQSDVDEEVSIGDYVLTNGCVAAIVVLDALSRFVPGVIGHEFSAAEDSFENGILDYPHYTRPELFENSRVPEVLLGGNHQQIEMWRHAAALEKTRVVRPDLFLRYLDKSKEEQGNEVKKRQQKVINAEVTRLTLSVSQLKKSIAFYRDRMGFELKHQEETKAFFVFGNQELVLILGLVSQERGGLPAFEMTVSEPEFFEMLVRHPEKRKQVSELKMIEFTDPDGYLWYLKKPS